MRIFHGKELINMWEKWCELCNKHPGRVYGPILFMLCFLWVRHHHEQPINPAWQECWNNCDQGIVGRMSDCDKYCSYYYNP
jgi:hypothetical protein